jgi:septum formation protein
LKLLISQYLTEPIMADAPNDVPQEPAPSYEAVPQQPPLIPIVPRLRAPLPLDIPALTSLRGKRVVLASASPRRKQLLSQIGLSQVEVIPSTFAEDLSKTLSPFEYVLQTATLKALKVYEQEIDNTEKGEPALIIAADTIVVSTFGDILEKPRSVENHISMLKMLRSSGSHKVYTAIALVAPLETAVEPGYKLETHVEDTSVRFDPNVTDELILAYVKTREGVDKAGGYGIQGKFAANARRHCVLTGFKA